MSLTRNPSMPYQAAGSIFQPAEKMHVHSHVHVPCAEAREDYDGRASYAAPANVRRQQQVRVSIKTVVLLSAVAMFVLAMFYISAVAKRASVYKERQLILDQMRSTQSQIVVLQEEIAKAQEESNIGYQAVHRLGMESSLGKEVNEIYAPNTRPAYADFSLSAGSVRAAADR